MKPHIKFRRGSWECYIPTKFRSGYGFGNTPEKAFKMYQAGQSNKRK